MAITKLQTFEDAPLTFSVALSESDDRLDCGWFNPVVKSKIEGLRKSDKIDRKLVKLKSLAEVKGGKRLPKGTVIIETEANIIPYVRAKDIKNLKVNLDIAIKLPKEVHREIQNYQLQQNDVVVTIVGTIGNVAILEQAVKVCNFTENIAKVRVSKDSILPGFILHFLNSEFAQMQMKRFSAGSVQYKLSLNSCRNIEVYVPFNNDNYDIDVQREILKEIEGLRKEASQLEGKAKELVERANSAVAERLKISVPDERFGIIFTRELEEKDQTSRLDALFNNPVREKLIANLKEYPHKQLGDLVELSRKGTIAPRDFYRLIELEQVDEKTGRITSCREVSSLGSKKILLKANKILVSKLQPEKGKVVIVPSEYDGTAGSSELIVLSLTSTKVSLDYLWAVLRSEYVLKQWKYTLTGSSRMRIGPTELKQTIIPIPDKKTQDAIVMYIKEMLAKSDDLLQQSTKLFKESKKYFMSALVN